MATEKGGWSKDVVIVNPKDRLDLIPNDAVALEIVNNGQDKVMYKLKATRPKSIHPDLPHGTVDGSGGRVTVKISFKPKAEEGPFSAKDHLTILVSPLGERPTPEEYWKSPEAKQAQRLVVPLAKK